MPIAPPLTPLLLDKIEDCRKDVNVIEKIKEDKVIKLVATKDGVSAGIKTQLSKFDFYLQGKRRQVDVAVGAEEDLELDDCLSGKKINEIPDVLKALANEFRNLYPGSFTKAKENLYYRCSAYKGKGEKKKFIRARLHVLAALKRDRPHVDVVKTFLKLIDEHKSERELNTDKDLLMALYIQATD